MHPTPLGSASPGLTALRGSYCANGGLDCCERWERGHSLLSISGAFGASDQGRLPVAPSDISREETAVDSDLAQSHTARSHAARKLGLTHGLCHTRDRCRSWAIPAVLAISSCSPCPLRHSMRGHRRCMNGRVPEEMMRSTFFATSSPASAGARALRPLAQQEADVAPFFPTDRLHVAPERFSKASWGSRCSYCCLRSGWPIS
jgi:hypothetical protein